MNLQFSSAEKPSVFRAQCYISFKRDLSIINYPKWGPPFIKSNTWAGFSNCLNRRRNFTPWLSPLLELTKTNRGLTQNENVALQKPVKKKKQNTAQDQYVQLSLFKLLKKLQRKKDKFINKEPCLLL